METLKFEINIYASLEKIWDVLWNENTYSQWTKFFAEGLVFKTDWQVGGRTYFLNPEGDGMVSTINSLNIPNEVVFSHLGLMKNNVETLKTKEVEEWSGLEEKYFLMERENFVNLKVILRSPNPQHEMMTKAFTLGLEKVKMLSEQA